MKKHISLLMIATLLFVLFSNCSAAEHKEFVYRDNIHFGDSSAEVHKKEPDTYSGLEEDDLMATDISLSGFSGCTLCYYFKDHKLNSIRTFYCADDQKYSMEILKGSFDTIEEGLTRKYGEPITNYDQMDTPPEGLIYMYQGKFGKYVTILTANQRTVYCDGYKVVIEHVFAEWNSIDKDQHEIKYYINGVTYVQVMDDETIVDNDL